MRNIQQQYIISKLLFSVANESVPIRLALLISNGVVIAIMFKINEHINEYVRA